MKSQGFTGIDLFAGAGGFSLSAINMDVEILAAVELDHDSCQTYRKNIKNKSLKEIEVFERDIQKLDPYEVMKKVGLRTKELDLLLGGPPCQGFSAHRILDAGVNDPRNALILRYFDFVKALNPKVFVVENVPGLLWKRHELYLQRFKSLSKRSGYKLLEVKKINAKDYGVPQHRQRVFIVGVRTDIDAASIEWPPKKTHFPPGSGFQEWKTASTVFEPAPKTVVRKVDQIINHGEPLNLVFGEKIPPKRQDPCALHMNHSHELIERFKTTPVNGSRGDNGFTLKCHQGNYRGHLDTYGRVRLAQPGPTMTTGCTNPSKGRFLHPWKNHGITIRHAARFQTFPDSFIFTGGMISQSRQIGNAVPIELGKVIVKEALSPLLLTQEKKKHG